MLGDAPYAINYAENPVVNETFNNNVNAMDDTAYKNMGDEDLEPKSLLSKFYDNAFRIGTSNAFETLSAEYENSINLVVDKINEYVEAAQAAREAIEAAISKDQTAHKLALEAKETALNNYPSYETVVANSDSSSYAVLQYYADKKAAGDKAYNDVWNSNCWKYEG